MSSVSVICQLSVYSYSNYWTMSNCSGIEPECERLTGEEGFERVESGTALLAPGAEQAAQAAERLGTAGAAEGAGDLSLDLDHAQVALSLVVGISRQLHPLPLLRRECSRSPTPFIPSTASSLRS